VAEKGQRLRLRLGQKALYSEKRGRIHGWFKGITRRGLKEWEVSEAIDKKVLGDKGGQIKGGEEPIVQRGTGSHRGKHRKSCGNSPCSTCPPHTKTRTQATRTEDTKVARRDGYGPADIDQGVKRKSTACAGGI